MYHELNINDNQILQDDIQSQFFECLELGVGGICVPSYFIPLIYNSLPDGFVLSTHIDYPNGMADYRIKNHAIINVIRKGANAVNVVLNPNHIINSKIDLVEKAIKGHLDICKDKSVSLRILLEYRDFELKKTLEMAELLAKYDVEYVFPSTGTKLDNYSDNLIIGKEIEKRYSGINCITNGNIWKKDQYEVIKNSGIFGVRFNSIHAIKNCLVNSGV